MRFLLSTLLILIVVSPSRVFGACITTDDCLREIEAARKKDSTLRADFTQTKHISLLNEPIVSTGRFEFRAPDRAEWTVVAPNPMTILIEGTKIVAPGLTETDAAAIAASPAAGALRQVRALFNGEMTELKAGFEVTAAEQNSRIVVHLIPRSETWRRVFTSIDLEFVRPELFLDRMRMGDPLGDRVDVEFRNTRVDSTVR